MAVPWGPSRAAAWDIGGRLQSAVGTTGPLTQATGPLTQCGGVAICMLRGNPVLTGNSMLDVEKEPRTNRLFNVGRYLPSPY